MNHPEVTPCDLPQCGDDSHVVLFGNPDAHTHVYEFGGLSITRREHLGFCLKHGGDIYDANHRRAFAKWLNGYEPWELPVPSLPDHRPPSPASTPAWDRPKRPYYGGDKGPKPRREDGPPRDRQRRKYEHA